MENILTASAIALTGMKEGEDVSAMRLVKQKPFPR